MSVAVSLNHAYVITNIYHFVVKLAPSFSTDGDFFLAQDTSSRPPNILKKVQTLTGNRIKGDILPQDPKMGEVQ